MKNICKCSGLNSYIKNGVDLNGLQRWKCKYCKKSYSTKNQLKPLCTNFAYIPVNKLSKDYLYALGFTIADGCLTKGRLQFTLKPIDIDQLYLLKRIFNFKNKISTYNFSNGLSQVYTAFKASYFIEDLLHLGIMPRKTGKEIWLPYMENHHFVRGFFDGDGSVHIKTDKAKNHKAIRTSFCCSNKKFISQLNNYISKELNIAPKTVYKGKSAYKIVYNKSHSNLLCEWMYKNSEGLRLERKYNKYLEIKDL